jgi:ribonuclease D
MSDQAPAPRRGSSSSSSTSIIEDRAQLAVLVERIFTAGVVAVDTEFVWERTFFPRLGLVQVALGTGDGLLSSPCAGVEPWLIDAPAVGDLSLLGLVLVAPDVVKIVHDGQQDLTILRRAAGCGSPRNIFDTRLAAGFAGLSSVISLSNLLEGLCGVALDKSATRTNWLQRPLSPEQLDYALDDVRYMPAIWRKLRSEVSARGNLDWLQTEHRLLEADQATAERCPEEAFLRVKGRGRLDARGLAVLRSLASWREREAARRDRPRGHIVGDDALVALATRLPQSPRAVGQAAGLGRRTTSHYADKLARLIAESSSSPEASWPQPAPRRRKAPGATERAVALIELVEQRAEARGIDAAVVSSRGDLRALAATAAAQRVESDHGVLRGWRRELLGDELDVLLAS